MTLNEILSTVMYDVTFKNGITLHGNLDYVSQHYGDDEIVSNKLSDKQPASVKEFCDNLFNYNKKNNTNLSITDFYNQIWSK